MSAAGVLMGSGGLAPCRGYQSLAQARGRWGGGLATRCRMDGGRHGERECRVSALY